VQDACAEPPYRVDGVQRPADPGLVSVEELEPESGQVLQGVFWGREVTAGQRLMSLEETCILQHYIYINIKLYLHNITFILSIKYINILH
jgi:hypothetical protein